jgi:RNA polymerase sigma factor for flagellar operon FliA
VLLEDLISIGTMGLIQAIDRYDPRRKLKLKTLAEHRIRGAMLDYLRKLDPLPRSVRHFYRRREEVAICLQQSSGDAPPASEIAAELKLSLSRYRCLDYATQGGIVLRLENMTSNDHVRSATADLSAIEQMDLLHGLDSAIRNLPEPERTVMESIQFGVSLCEIARRLHKPQSYVSQIRSNGLHRLRTTLGASPGSS